MTTVGYGDHSPTTGLGRVLAVGLMLSGIALLGVVTANIAAWFISRFERDDRAEMLQLAAIRELQAEVRALRGEVARLGGAPAPAPAPARPRPGPGHELIRGRGRSGGRGPGRCRGRGGPAERPGPAGSYLSHTLNARTW